MFRGIGVIRLELELFCGPRVRRAGNPRFSVTKRIININHLVHDDHLMS